MHKDLDFDNALDQALNNMRSGQPEAGVAEAAAARVWQRLQQEHAESNSPDALTGCDAIRPLLPAYRAGTLNQAKEWLVQDHLHECASCRKLATGPTSAAAAVLPWKQTAVAAPIASRKQKYAWAAAIIATAGLSLYGLRDRFLPAPDGPRATLEWSDGPVYIVTSAGQRALKNGGTVGEAEWVRTATNSRAVFRLLDGSRVEMNQLGEMSVAVNRRDTTVSVERGAIIVNATKRRAGHLYVSTRDANVAVTGTVFAVNRGMKGTRVSVAEGEVHVDMNGNDHTLHHGDQVASDQTLGSVAVRDEFAWSRNFNEHLALLKDLKGLASDVSNVQMPGLRYESKVLQALPADTLLYVAIPNLGDQLANAYQIFESRLQQSSALQKWWASGHGEANDANVSRLIDFARGAASYLGDEMVLVFTGDTRSPHVALIAETQREGLQQYVDSQLAEMGVKGRPELRFNGNYVIVSPPGVAGAPEVNLNGGFANTPFGQKIAQAYHDGAGFLVCADLASLHPAGDGQAMGALGLNSVRYLIVEQRSINGSSESRATLNFDGPRQGIASWLAPPAPMGSMSFVSPGAVLSASFIVKDPQQMVDDLIGMFDKSNPQVESKLANTRRELGVDLRNELAASIGNDVTVSIDGPVLPVPSWKIAIEVKDPVMIERSLKQIVDRCNQERAGCAKLSDESGQVRDRRVHSLEVAGSGQGFVYTFTDGYLVLAANRETLMRGLRAKDQSYGLAESHNYRSLLPFDRQANFSAVIYHNLAGVAQVLTDAANAAGAITPEQREQLAAVTANTRPGLIYAYGLDDRIQLASNGGLFGLTLENLASSAGIAQLMHQAPTGFANLGKAATLRKPQTAERTLRELNPPVAPRAPRPPAPRE